MVSWAGVGWAGVVVGDGEGGCAMPVEVWSVGSDWWVGEARSLEVPDSARRFRLPLVEHEECYHCSIGNKHSFWPPSGISSWTESKKQQLFGNHILLS